MVTVTQEGDRVIFDVRRSHKLWALTSRLEIPRQHIRGARKDPSVVNDFKGWKTAGTRIPGVLAAGTFHLWGKRVFWDVHNAGNTLVIDLDHEDYDQLVIEVENPDSVVAMLSAAK